MSVRPVLCAFDAEEPSVLAAQAAAWLAEELGAPLELVYVLDHDELPALPPAPAGAGRCARSCWARCPQGSSAPPAGR